MNASSPSPGGLLESGDWGKWCELIYEMQSVAGKILTAKEIGMDAIPTSRHCSETL